jgi:hypothetical protein
MPKTSQLRMYRIAEGKLQEFVDGWRSGVVPLRLKQGFTVDGAWVAEEESRFVWIVSYDGPEDWNAKDAAYYASPERKSLEPDPAKLIAESQRWLIRPVPARD